MGLFQVIPLPGAVAALKRMPKEDRSVVEGALSQLAIDPEPPNYWTCGEESEGRYIFAGERDRWKISYQISRHEAIVYVHAIKRRPTLDWDPE
jgi:mRNA-degrading endonuclease RelE of RelBE toxin-antitoxin system